MTNEEKLKIVAQLISTPEGRQRIFEICQDDLPGLATAVKKSKALVKESLMLTEARVGLSAVDILTIEANTRQRAEVQASETTPKRQTEAQEEEPGTEAS